MTDHANALPDDATDQPAGTDFTALCQRIRAHLLVDGAAVSLPGDHNISLAACTAEEYGRLERAQHFHAKGATLLAQTTGQVVAVDELDAHASQWPEFCDLASRIGVHSILAIPIGPEVDIVVSIYSRTPRHWTSSDITACTQIARRRSLHMTRSLHDDDPDPHQTRVAPTKRTPHNVTTATALIARQRGVSQELAAHLLTRLARQTGLPLGAVADAVIRATSPARAGDQSAS